MTRRGKRKKEKLKRRENSILRDKLGSKNVFSDTI